MRFGTVGRPLPGVELRIAADGEVLVRGPGVFDGYYKNTAATDEAFTADGYFRTGDIGSLNADGYLSITDRKKAIVVTAGGKNVAPGPIEGRIMRSPYVSQAVVAGSERPYLVALLVPDEEALAEWAQARDLPTDRPSLLAQKEVQALMQDAVDAANAELERFETIKRFRVLETPFSVETGELTPTLKLRRRVVVETYKGLIASIYED